MDAQHYRIIDAHAHIFPARIAERASQNIGAFYDLPMEYIGRSDQLIESGAAIGVSRYLVCSTATRPEQVPMINDFIAESCKARPELFGFGTLHPAYDRMQEELERICALGLHGVKLHSDFQQFDIDDPAAMPMYRLIEKAGLPVLFHMGDQSRSYSQPERLAAVARAFPNLRCIAAHFGGYCHWDEALASLPTLANVWFDSSSSLAFLEQGHALAMLETIGVERFFFGTDFPMWDHREELGRFLSLGLSEGENRKILAENFEGFFGLAVS